jgi:chemotaxis protein MotB
VSKHKADRPATIVIRKAKKGHGAGHHGGAWKVAYADFVTAMMAFFMVMWILGMDQKTRQAIEGYFSNPIGFKKGYSSGKTPVSAGTSPASVSTTPIRLLSQRAQEARFEQTSRHLRERLEGTLGLDSLLGNVEITVGKEGLRIELVEGRGGDTFFPLGSSEPKPVARQAIAVIADELRLLDNPVVIEGHTDAAPFGGAGYSNWELSGDRANAARRIVESAGVAPRRVIEVRGLADRRLRVADDPLAPANRRISILLPFIRLPDGPTVGPVAARAPAAEDAGLRAED